MPCVVSIPPEVVIATPVLDIAPCEFPPEGCWPPHATIEGSRRQFMASGFPLTSAYLHQAGCDHLVEYKELEEPPSGGFVNRPAARVIPPYAHAGAPLPVPRASRASVPLRHPSALVVIPSKRGISLQALRPQQAAIRMRRRTDGVPTRSGIARGPGASRRTAEG